MLFITSHSEWSAALGSEPQLLPCAEPAAMPRSHFDAFNHGTFSQRYIVVQSHYVPDAKSPVFCFTGAEGGDITLLYSSGDYGSVQDVAR
jgi:hypothetical protein